MSALHQFRLMFTLMDILQDLLDTVEEITVLNTDETSNDDDPSDRRFIYIPDLQGSATMFAYLQHRVDGHLHHTGFTDDLIWDSQALHREEIPVRRLMYAVMSTVKTTEVMEDIISVGMTGTSRPHDPGGGGREPVHQDLSSYKDNMRLRFE